MVGQEPVLYARSLSENIAYGLLESEWSQDDVQEAAKLANAHMFVCEMKDKYKTQTGEKGAQLSGKNKRIHHECEGGIENSVLRITVCHHEACRVMTNGDP